MSWDEPLAALERSVSAFDAMAAGEASRALAEGLAERGQELLLEGWAKQQAPDGTPWAAPARDYGHPLLDKTGAMKASAKCFVGPRDDAGGFSLTFEVSDEKAAWHQFGTFQGGPTSSPLRPQSRKTFRAGQAERAHIPARPMIFSSIEQAAKWVADLELVAVTRFETWLSARLAF